MKTVSKIRTFTRSSKLNAFIALAVSVAVVATGIVIVATRASGNATLTLTPSSSTVGLGNNFSVTITENSSTVSVNAVEADLTYDPARFEFVSIDTSSSPFNLVARATGGNGAVYVSSATSTPVTGSRVVAVVTFKAIGLGSSPITFAAGSAIVESTNNTDTLGTTTGGTYTVADQTAPNAPTGLTVGTRTATSISFSWTAPSDNVGVTGYKVYRGTTQIGTTASTSYTDTGLSPSNNYSYSVAAYDAAGNTSSKSSTVSTSTTADTTAPGAPGAPSLSTRTLTSITFSWNAATDNVGVTGYRVYRGGTQIGTTASTSYTDNGLTPNTSYSYRVSAYDAAGNNSAQSGSTSLTTLADTSAPSVPTNLSSPTQGTTTVTLSWSASTDNVGVLGYRVYRGSTQVGTTANTTFTDTGLTPGTQYTYSVAAYDAAGNVSNKSSTITASPVAVPGDANGDTHVTIVDLSILASTWQSTIDLRGDFNHDGIVNILDLSILAANWGR